MSRWSACHAARVWGWWRGGGRWSTSVVRRSATERVRHLMTSAAGRACCHPAWHPRHAALGHSAGARRTGCRRAVDRRFRDSWSRRRRWTAAWRSAAGPAGRRARHRTIGSFSTTLTYRPTKATEFRKITQNKGYYVVQGHSRSPILVQNKRPYATFY